VTDPPSSPVPGPPALADRRLARFLFKLVQQPTGQTWMLPTRRFLTLHLLFGRTGYPAPVLDAATSALTRGLVVPYRHPYEIPDLLVISMFPLPFADELPLIGWLVRNDMLFLYDEEPIQQEQPRYGLDAWLPGQWLRTEQRAHLETTERTRAQYGDEDDDLDGYESVVAAVSATAAASGGFPAFLLPAIAEKWTASSAPSLHRYALAERLMLERLPRRLLGFGDLAELARTEAVAILRAELGREAGQLEAGQLEAGQFEAGQLEAGQLDRIGAAVDGVAAEVRRRGIGYREIILARDDLTRIGAGFEPVAGAYPGQAVMKSLADSAAVRLYTASVAIDGFEDAPELLLVPGPELWIPPVDLTYIAEIYSRLQFGGLDGMMKTYAPL
jgi:hypothetical protein